MKSYVTKLSQALLIPNDMLNKTMLTLCLLLSGLHTLVAGNRIYSERFKSLETVVNDNWLDKPVMTLGSDDVLYIDFDEMSHN